MNELRYELKFTTSSAHLFLARRWIRLHPEAFRTAFQPRQINSIYLDTPRLHDLNANLIGHRQRRKIRVRWYGQNAHQAENPILELKMREGYLGDKKRIALDSPINLTHSWQEIIAQIYQAATGKEPAWRQILHPQIHATIINQYQREYYVSPDGQLRLTLDFQQSAYNQRLSLTPNLKFKVQQPDQLVIELKGSPEVSERLETAAFHLPIRRNRNSKYINAMQALPL